MTSGVDAFVHVWQPSARADTPVLLMLHGTGGNERELLPLAFELMPSAAVLSPRGQVLENGMPRFFRRIAEGVFDEVDLRRRATELAEFVSAAKAEYMFEGRPVVAVGYSNGANVAGAILLLKPGTLDRAVLLRAMVPLVLDPPPDLRDASILISNGRVDPLVAVEQTERLARLFQKTGAAVELRWQRAGHGLVEGDVIAAKTFLAAL